MSAGPKEIATGISNYRRSLRNNPEGFSLIEVLIVAFILSVLTAGLILALNIGEFSNTVTSAKLDLDASLRQLLPWILKDVRQAVRWEIASDTNQPSSTHIKFKQVQGWDSVNETWVWSEDYIEYEYDPALKKITRRLIDENGNIIQTWEFNDIIEAPFYTRYDDAVKEFKKEDLQTSGQLIIVISMQKQAQGSLSIPFILKAEAKIRNG